MNTSRKRRWQLGLLLLLLLFFVLGWSAWPDRKVAAAKQMQQELFSPEARTLSPQQRQEKWRALREAQKNLSPAQRQELSREMRKRRQQEMARYFKMPPAEKRRFLDEQIQRMQQMQQMRAQRPGGQAGGGRGGPAGPGTPGSPPTANTAGAAANPTTAPTPGSRDQWRRERLDSTSPAERAQMTQFFQDLNARRAQLGLATGRGFGPGR